MQLASMSILLAVTIMAGFITVARPARGADDLQIPHTQPTGASDAALSPYALDPDHLWNRTHRALFVRTAADGTQRVHSMDPLEEKKGREKGVGSQFKDSRPAL